MSKYPFTSESCCARGHLSIYEGCEDCKTPRNQHRITLSIPVDPALLLTPDILESITRKIVNNMHVCVEEYKGFQRQYVHKR